MVNYNSIQDIFNVDSTNLNCLINNIQYDDNNFSITSFPSWLKFNSIAPTTIYASGNSWIGINSTSIEHIKFNRIDAAMYYLYDEVGTLYNHYNFYRIRWRGYSRYNQTTSAYLQEWEVVFFDTGDICIHAIAIPTSYYSGTFNIIASQTYTYTALTTSSQFVSFYSLDENNTTFNITQDIIDIETPWMDKYLIQENDILYTIVDNQLQEITPEPGKIDVANYDTIPSLWVGSGTPPTINKNTGDATAYVQPIKQGKTYTLTLLEDADRFRIATCEQTPVNMVAGETMNGVRLLLLRDNAIAGATVTFTAGNYENYLVMHVSATSLKPAISLEQDVSSLTNAFVQYGVDNAPDGEIIKTLTNPKVLNWIGTDIVEIGTLKASMIAVPFPQVLYSENYSMSHSTIAGINNVTSEVEGNVLFSVSVDSGISWKLFSGSEWVDVSDEVQGMTNDIMVSITSEQWNSFATTGMIRFRIIIQDITSKFISLVVNYINQSTLSDAVEETTEEN